MYMYVLVWQLPAMLQMRVGFLFYFQFGCKNKFQHSMTFEGFFFSFLTVVLCTVALTHLVIPSEGQVSLIFSEKLMNTRTRVHNHHAVLHKGTDTKRV